MIAELSVENVAIIERSNLRLGPGLTVLTGETGAGKSLLIDAIELALGERADSDLVRSGSRTANVSVVFDLQGQPEAQARCADLGIELEGGLLFVSREILVEGRSQCRIAGRLTPVSVLKQLGQVLVDLHGQHDHQSLLFPERHLGYLDLWIGESACFKKQQVREAFERHQAAKRQLEALRASVREREQKIDLLRYQVGEIELVAPMAGESEEIQAKILRLEHAERLATASLGALELLSEQEGSAVETLGAALKSLEDAARFDATLEAVLAPLREAVIQVDDAVRTLSSYSQQIESNPAELDELGNRLEALKKLRRKYGDDESEVLAFLAEAKSQLAILEDAEAGGERLAEVAEATFQELEAHCGELTKLRHDSAVKFAKLVEAQLHDLALERSRFEVGFKPAPPSPEGADEVEFVFTANPGEPLRPLARVASGGEVSRLMLAVKTALAGKAGVPTLIFDEIDSGLGGRVAGTVGKRLAGLAENYQVLVISHLPQVAALATVHYR
ncbi:MAG TPA: DNA repair protein RecN, partial [Fimbriimonas sp.]|nr:DNA repair protein RecN [Fimbriimonas sp.]